LRSHPRLGAEQGRHQRLDLGAQPALRRVVLVPQVPHQVHRQRRAGQRWDGAGQAAQQVALQQAGGGGEQAAAG